MRVPTTDTSGAPRSWWWPWSALGLGATAVGFAASGLMIGSRIDAADIAAALLVLAWSVGGACALGTPAMRRTGALTLGSTIIGAVALAAACIGANRGGDAGHVAKLIATLASPLVAAGALHVALGLPSGHLASRPRQVATLAGYGLALIAGVGLWLASGGISPTVGVAGSIVGAVAVVPAAHRRYLRSVGVERKRLQWLGSGVAAAVEVAVAVGAAHLLVGWPGAGWAVAAAGTASIPAGLAAGTSPRLVSVVDRVVVNIVSLAGLTVVVAGVYLVVIVGLGRAPDSGDRAVVAMSLAAAAVAAVLYMPLRTRLGEVANELVYGERHPPDEVLRSFGSRLTRAMPMDELLLQLAESLRKTMSLTSAAVFTGSAGVFERSASVPDRGPPRVLVGEHELAVMGRAGVSGRTWAAVWLPALAGGPTAAPLRVAPIVHSGEVLGAIVVERPDGGDEFTPEEDRVLTELARQAGLALHNAHLDSALQESLAAVRRQALQLQESRARIVEAADGERRRLERDLHDGAQQHLMALSVSIGLARQVADTDPTRVLVLLDQLGAEVQEATRELRRLAHGIYPPLLVERGLSEALAATAGRASLPTHVDTDGIARYPAAVEATVYFCCLEALHNAAKHAGAGATAWVRVWEDAGGLLFSVTDDGVGFVVGADGGAGAGFTNMGDRLGATGGNLQVQSRPGEGTVVAGTIPLDRVTG